MQNNYPKISHDKSRLLIVLNQLGTEKKIKNVDLLLDIDEKTHNPSGIEVINLADNLGLESVAFEEFSIFKDNIYWKGSYDPKHDIAYIGFSRNSKPRVKTKNLKGNIGISSKNSITSIEIFK